MAWPYHFVSLLPDQISKRRELLDLYGFYAWITPIVVVLSICLGRLIISTTSKSSYRSSNKAPTFLQLSIRRISWILNSPLSSDFGTLKVHLIGLLYSAWLLFLTVHRTGDDYMHFTKRLGHIAVSQLPLQYLLSIKSPLSPIQIATNLSHETLNPYHRLTGRILHLFLLAHATLYLNFFYAISALPHRFYDRDVQFGLLAITLLTALAITALPPIRQKTYHRFFYVPHVLLSFLLMPAIAAHVPYTRRYILQTLIIYLFNVATRKMNTESPPTPAIITLVEGTNGALLHISIPVITPPFGSPISTFSPGQHVYLKAGHDPRFPRSPFTVASVPPVLDVPEQRNAYRGYPIPDMELVVRNLGGPTTAWLSRSTADKTVTNTSEKEHPHRQISGVANGNTAANSPAPRKPSGKLDLLVEGPYGSSSTFLPPLLSSFSSPDTTSSSNLDEGEAEEILLLAAGIGATFTLPIYISLLRGAMSATATAAKSRPYSHSILPEERHAIELRAAASVAKRIHFRWIVRSREEAQWGIEYLRKADAEATREFEGRMEAEKAGPLPPYAEMSGGLGGRVERERGQRRREEQQQQQQQQQEEEDEDEKELDLARNLQIMNVKIYITRGEKGGAGAKSESHPDTDRLDQNEEQDQTPSSDLSMETPTFPPPLGVEIITPNQMSYSTTGTRTTTTSGPSARPSLAALVDSVLFPNSPPPPPPSPASQNQDPNPPHPLQSSLPNPDSAPQCADHNSGSRPPTSNLPPQAKAEYKYNKVSILTCAPPSLSHALRAEVGRHVMEYGREVWWWEEGFGMGS